MSAEPSDTNAVEVDPCTVCEHGATRNLHFVAVPPAPTLPNVRQVRVTDCYRWLRAGWFDMWRQPLASLVYGTVFAGFGALILLVTWEFPYLYTAAVSSFLLVAPILAAGLYEKSRRYLAGEATPGFTLSLAWRRNPGPLLGFGALCFLAGTLWQVISVFVIAVFYKGVGLKPLPMIIEILRNPEHNLLFAMYWGMGAVYAAVVFAVSVVSAPMLVDRSDARLLEALSTSINAVAENPITMAIWATIIMLLVGWGFITGLVGMIFVLPWLGHASFHAYKSLVE